MKAEPRSDGGVADGGVSDGGVAEENQRLEGPASRTKRHPTKCKEPRRLPAGAL